MATLGKKDRFPRVVAHELVDDGACPRYTPRDSERDLPDARAPRQASVDRFEG